jgi:hypothetical protein
MVSGILLGLVGTGFLILYGKSIVNPEQAGYGNFLVLLKRFSRMVLLDYKI